MDTQSTTPPVNPIAELVTRFLDGPPEFPPGSLAAGSATEDRAVDRWRTKLREDAREIVCSSAREVRILAAVVAEL